jgi:MoaA/NifB/PqqE/SkfB family radical SAM enzyme
MSAIDNVKAMRSGGKPGIIIKATVSSKNVRHLAALAELADRRGIEGFRFQLAQVVKNANFVFDRSLLLTDKERAILVQQLDRLIQRFAYLLSGSLEYYQGLRDFLERPESVRKFRSISGFSFVVIDPWGRLFTSPAKVQEIGNIRRDSFQSIWYGEAVNRLRRQRDSRPQSSYLFDDMGSMSVSVGQLNAMRFLKLLGPIFAGAKSF